MDEDGLWIQGRDAPGIDVVRTLDGLLRPEQLTRTGGFDTRFYYDVANRLTKREFRFGGVLKTTRDLVYDTSTKRLTSTQATVAGSTATRTTTYEYNGWHRLKRVLDANSRSRSLYYDGFGRLRRTSDDLLGVGNGNDVVFTGDAVGNVSKLESREQKDQGGGQYVVVTYTTDILWNEWDLPIQIDRKGTGWGNSYSYAGSLPAARFDPLGLTSLLDPTTHVVTPKLKITGTITWKRAPFVYETRTIRTKSGAHFHIRVTGYDEDGNPTVKVTGEFSAAEMKAFGGIRTFFEWVQGALSVAETAFTAGAANAAVVRGS